jgi:hypothetical protein
MSKECDQLCLLTLGPLIAGDFSYGFSDTGQNCSMFSSSTKSSPVLRKPYRNEVSHAVLPPDLVQKVYDALSCVAWAANIQGFSMKVGTEYLATYMNDDWL